MSKTIIFCADGTWDHPNQTDHNQPADTNVYKLFQALAKTTTQVQRYDDGVGVDGSVFDHLLGYAFGKGLLDKVKDGYSFLADTYQEGDRIYLFGFSRGAYTVRSLAGMVAACGLPPAAANSPQAVEDAFNAYRSQKNRAQLKAALQVKYGNRDVGIEMIGVWDTVGSLGIPLPVFSKLDHLLYGFLDTSLSLTTKSAYQALSVDENRAEFEPTLWQPLSPAALAAGNILEQAWFAGTHVNVGSGIADTALSDITLSWMFKKALGKGVLFDPSAYAQRTAVNPANALGAIHNSWTPLLGPPVIRTIPSNAFIANSVEERIQKTSYRPKNLTLTPSGLAAGYSIVLVI